MTEARMPSPDASSSGPELPGYISDVAARTAATVAEVVVPCWPMPMAGRRNPAMNTVRRLHERWLETSGLLASSSALLDLQAWEIAAYAYPDASFDVLQLGADWTALYVHIDDYFDQGSVGNRIQTARDVTEFLRGHVDQCSHPPSGKAELRETREAYRGLLARTRQWMTPPQVGVFNSHLASYFDALVEEAAYREAGRIPSLEEYCRFRRFTGPMQPLIDLVELSVSLRLPPGIYTRPEYLELIDATSDITSWANDIFSAGKELARGEVHNILHVMRHHMGIPLPEAARLAVGHVRARIEQMDQPAAALARWIKESGASPSGRQAVQTWVRALHEWQHHCAYYFGKTRYASATVTE
ncbi:hypothetical protein ABZ400_37205 [Streptomyces sp. NPDC005897]|uniref:terpene synthase family protein n=1 Tax=Streptomyces sp. NPDC005897 TaxID=3157081 RepID=UPI0033C0C102